MVQDIVIEDGPIGIDQMEHICRHTSLSGLSEVCSRVTYSQLYQIHAELQSRAGCIDNQLNTKQTNDMEWKIKARSALDIIRNKASIASYRLQSIRNNHIQILLNRIGGVSNVKSKRLLMIKCLIFLIENYCSFSKLSPEEKAVIDSCRTIGDMAEEVKFDTLSYDTTRGVIISSDNSDLALMTRQDYMSEEYGFLFSFAPDMVDLLKRAESISNNIMRSQKCSSDNCNGEKCMRCRTEKLCKDINDLLIDIK